MAEENKKKGGGFKKFALGALLGVAAGAIAGKFISKKDGCDCDEECDGDCDCGCKKKKDEDEDDD